jgi:hypothetical protein
MKRVLLAKLLLLLPALAQIPPAPVPPSAPRVSGEIAQAGQGLVEGVVKKQNTGEPISGVTVTLTGLGTVGQRTETTDGEGRFIFRNLPQSRYSVNVRRDGYFFRRSLSGTLDSGEVTVGSGRSVTTVAFSLMQGGIISGRILDSAGRPTAGAQVSAARVNYQNGYPVLTPAKSTAADDRGDYRLFWLEPGEYLVLAEKNLPTGPARGYFPGGDDGRAAMTVAVGEGMESSRIDFSLGRIPASVTVSGAVTSVVPGFETRLALQSKDAGPQAPTPADVRAIQAGAALQFYLLPLDAGRSFEGPALFPNTITSSEDRAAGKFELRNVRSGSYELYAILLDRASVPSKYYVAHSTVEVAAEDLGGLALFLAPGLDVKGKIRFATNISATKVRVSLRPKAMFPGWTGASVETTDGTFNIPNVPESQYNITVESSEPNTYVADLLQGNINILDRGIVTVSQTLPDLIEAVMQASAATIQGRVLAESPQLEAGAIVALVPEDSRRENLALYRRSIATGGTFSFTGVAPGMYKLFAWSRIPDGAEQNAEFMHAYKDKGLDVVAAAGGTSSVEVRLIGE